MNVTNTILQITIYLLVLAQINEIQILVQNTVKMPFVLLDIWKHVQKAAASVT